LLGGNSETFRVGLKDYGTLHASKINFKKWHEATPNIYGKKIQNYLGMRIFGGIA
jgi:hypothetical protein